MIIGVSSPHRGLSQSPVPLLPPGRWAPGSAARLVHALGLVLFQILLNGVAFRVIAPAVLGGDDFDFRGSIAEFIVVGVLATTSMGINVGLALCVVGHITPKELGWSTQDWTKDAAAGLFGFGLCALALFALAAIESGRDGPSEVLRSMASYTLAQRLLFLSIGLSAAAYEESLFRGYLQPELTRRVGTIAGVIATAAIFALYHLRFGPSALGGKLAVGLVLGGLRVTRSSLAAPAIAHALLWAVIGAA